MGNGNKDKGKRVEREVCELLGGVFGLSFTRVPNSGAFTGGRNFNRVKTLSQGQNLLYRGDIIPPDELRNLVVEVKSRQEFAFHQLVSDCGCSELEKWIGQVELNWRENERKGMFLLVFKPNRRGYFVCHREGALPSSGNFSRYSGKQGLNDDGAAYIVREMTEDWLKSNKEAMLAICSN